MKTVQNTIVESNEIILPNDLNNHGSLFGGRLVSMIDKIAAISAYRHAENAVATLSIDQLLFKAPVPVGSQVRLRASVNRSFNSSMEVGVIVEAFTPESRQQPIHVCSAYLTFVALPENGQKKILDQIHPLSEAEERRFRNAELRRKHRFSLAESLENRP